jgi:hypothetical protein
MEGRVNESDEVAAYRHHDDDEDFDEEEVAGLYWLPAELWAMVCEYLGTGDLARLSTTCWTLRSHALAKVRHHTFTPLGTPHHPPPNMPISQLAEKIYLKLFRLFYNLIYKLFLKHCRTVHAAKQHEAGVGVCCDLAGPRVARALRLGRVP